MASYIQINWLTMSNDLTEDAAVAQTFLTATDPLHANLTEYIESMESDTIDSLSDYFPVGYPDSAESLTLRQSHFVSVLNSRPIWGRHGI